ncbi:MAG TPA: ABC transporter ATP-binding protein [Candidatus Saccharimonadales bacterium]
MGTAIRIKNLSVTLAGKKILNDITVDLPEGHIIGLLGPSGAGKTTLIRTLVGRQHITEGSATILGHLAGSALLRSEIGYMTQSPSVYLDLTVRENVRYFAIMTGQTGRHADELIKQVELVDYAGQLVGKLSGGQRSRVSLAVALLGRPKILVLDEPTVGVDPVLRQQLWAMFGQLAGHGTTLLISSHVMDEAGRCQDLLLLRDGRLLAYDTPDGLITRTGTKTVEAGFIKLVGDKT